MRWCLFSIIFNNKNTLKPAVYAGSGVITTKGCEPLKRLSGRTFGITILVLLFITADFFILPLLAEFPRFLAKNPMQAATNWTEVIKAEPFAGPKMLLNDTDLRRLWLYLQPLVVAGFFYLLWQPGIRKRKNRIGDGVGGPEQAEYSITHGSSRWQTKKEIDRNTTTWRVDQKPPKGGVVLGYDPDRGKAWLETGDLHTMIIGGNQIRQDKEAYLSYNLAVGKGRREHNPHRSKRRALRKMSGLSEGAGIPYSVNRFPEPKQRQPLESHFSSCSSRGAGRL